MNKSIYFIYIDLLYCNNKVIQEYDSITTYTYLYLFPSYYIIDKHDGKICIKYSPLRGIFK